MNKLLLSLSSVFVSANVFALTSLEQAKVDTVSKMYQEGEFYKFVTPDLKKLLLKAQKHDDSPDVYSDPDALCLGGPSAMYGSGQDSDPSKPEIKFVAGKIHATFLKMKHDKSTKITLKYSLECKNEKCLVSDLITEYGDSYKQSLAQCVKNSY